MGIGAAGFGLLCAHSINHNIPWFWSACSDIPRPWNKVVQLCVSTKVPKCWETHVRFEKPHDKLRKQLACSGWMASSPTCFLDYRDVTWTMPGGVRVSETKPIKARRSSVSGDMYCIVIKVTMSTCTYSGLNLCAFLRGLIGALARFNARKVIQPWSTTSGETLGDKDRPQQGWWEFGWIWN